MSKAPPQFLKQIRHLDGTQTRCKVWSGVQPNMQGKVGSAADREDMGRVRHMADWKAKIHLLQPMSQSGKADKPRSLISKWECVIVAITEKWLKEGHD